MVATSLSGLNNKTNDTKSSRVQGTFGLLPLHRKTDLKKIDNHLNSDQAIAKSSSKTNKGVGEVSNDYSKPPSDAHLTPPVLRGLNNMGHTCFMNAILQALLQVPFLKDFYFSEGHLESGCDISQNGGHCIACELGNIVYTSHSGENTPFSPAEFLQAWWMLAEGALGGGCKQQDAHEFFLFILNMLSNVNGMEEFIPQLFSGTLRSDIICSACGAISTSKDEFTHLSLDIPPPSRLLPRPILPRSKTGLGSDEASKNTPPKKKRSGKQLIGAAKAAHLAKLTRQQADMARKDTNEDGDALQQTSFPHLNGNSSNTPKTEEKKERLPANAAAPLPGPQGAGLNSRSTPPTKLHPLLSGYYRWPGAALIGCLRRFVWAEKLPSHESMTCQSCGSCQGAVKQLSLEKLPPVLVLHAKRFEHSGNVKIAAKKLDTYVIFPMTNLDLRPYLSASILKKKVLGYTAFRGRPSQASPGTPKEEDPSLTENRSSLQTGEAPWMSSVSSACEDSSVLPPRAYFSEKGNSQGKLEGLMYDLFAVVCHRGTFQGGHYIAYVKSNDNKWYLCDDACITVVNEDAVKNSQAYMLFYARKDILPR